MIALELEEDDASSRVRGKGRLGVEGESVVLEVQQLLAQAGHSPGPIDGIFGSLTETAVRAFQTARSLLVDGVVDQATRDALG